MGTSDSGPVTSAASALQRPVGTVLSGPAASVIGACALSGRQDGVVADMGGTTTDIAIVRNGRPALAFDGAMIGGCLEYLSLVLGYQWLILVVALMYLIAVLIGGRYAKRLVRV